MKQAAAAGGERSRGVLRAGWAAAAMVVVTGCAAPVGEPAVDWSLLDHAVDLVAGLPMGLVRAETRRIDFGTPSSHDFLVAGWTGEEVFADDGSTFAWSLGEGSTVGFVVLRPRPLALEARLRPYRIDGPPQKVVLELNGEPVRTFRLKGGMRTYRLTLPAEAMVRGQNLLRVRNVYPRNIGPGPPDLGPPGTAWDYLELDTGDPAGWPEARPDALWLPFGTEVRYFFELPATSYLTLAGLEGSHRRGRLVVRTRRAGEVQERELRAREGAVTVPLTGAKPGLVGITLAALWDGSRPGAGGLVLRQPHLRWAGPPLPERPRSVGERRPGPRRRPNVILYLVDTLRADHLGCYGYPRPSSPHIDAFAADAVVFDETLAQSSWTRSAVASLLTGLLPTAHGVHGRDDALPPEALTLAELLGREGYATAAFVTNGNAGRASGLAQGFTTFELLGEHDSEALHSLSDEVNQAVFRWLGKAASEPFFLYLHTMDPHTPYAPPDGEAPVPALSPETAAAIAALGQENPGRFASEAGGVRIGSMTWMRALDHGLIPVDPAMTADLVALYDAEIAFNDRHFGAFLDRLRALGLYDRSLIVLLSDHGEEFYDHGGWSHGRTLYHEQLRIPLIIRFPDPAVPRGVRRSGPGRQIDVLPTVLDYLGLPFPAGAQGESLLPSVLGGAAGRRPGYARLDLDGRFAEALVEGRWKLLCPSRLGVGCRLYDLAGDPREEVDLAARRPVFAGYLQSRMRVLRGQGPRLDPATATLEPALRARLEALGYLDSQKVEE